MFKKIFILEEKNIPSSLLKTFLVNFYLLFIVPPLFLISIFVYNGVGITFPYCENISTDLCSCDKSFTLLLSIILVLIFGLLLRMSFLHILKLNVKGKKLFYKVILWVLISIFIISSFCALWTKLFVIPALYTATGKPVIYLYPEKTTDVKVKLDFKGKITADYPDYDNNIKGWEVEAHPDGQLINKKDNQEYSYLYWEGDIAKGVPLDMKTGFVVKGSDTKAFLQKTLKEVGLSPKEYNEFIVYWYPIMMKNNYNFIHFAGKDYTDIAPLTITPKPDSVLRVFMVFKALDKPIAVEPQAFPTFERKGFTVVEWGGIESK